MSSTSIRTSRPLADVATVTHAAQRRRWWRMRSPEGRSLAVGLPGDQAVVELTEEAVGRVPQRGGAPVAGRSSPVVVLPGPRGMGQRRERPDPACRGETIVLAPSAGDDN